MERASDRRTRPRFPINTPITVLTGDQQIPAYTRDMSDTGVFFYHDSAGGNRVGSEFDFVIEFPPEITLSSYCPVRCRGRVVREEAAPGELTGIAVEILRYSILRATPLLA